MINKKITYERDVHKSYMKVPAIEEEILDERLILRKPHQGALAVEKCYINGVGEYWYNISGKQALDAYCQDNAITKEFFKKVLLRICNQLEMMEWNLIDSSCLLVEPEYIFVSPTGDEIEFVLYPDEKANIFERLQHLAEYMLTKLNHTDREGIHIVYRIYEIILAKKYSIKELKAALLEMQEEGVEDMQPYAYKEENLMQEVLSHPMEKGDIFHNMFEKCREFCERVKNLLWKKNHSEQIPNVVYPEEEIEEAQQVIHPTVCMTVASGANKGILIYDGREDYPDFQLNTENCIIGKSPRVKFCIDKETISQFHAKIEYFEQVYYIEDMNSTNGTYVNEELLNYKERRALFSGDIIRFADVKYRFL